MSATAAATSSPLSPAVGSSSRPGPSRKPSLNPSPSLALSPATDTPRARPTRRASAMSSGSNGPVSGGGAEQRRARREQLRNFYGLKGVDEGSAGSSGAGVGEGSGARGEGSMSLDSNTFDAPAYYENLIATSSLAELMQTASSLAGEIGNLQSSRHALVYNHHHQLFSAGDTISHLNSRTPQLLGIMTELQDSFSEISRLVDSVAGPTAGAAPSEAETKVQRSEQARMLGERVRLMVLAEEPPDKIRNRYAAFQAELDQLDEAQRSDLRDLRLDCEALVGQLPDPPDPDAPAPVGAP